MTTQLKITLELDKVDALAVLSAVEDGALSWRLQAAISTGVEREYAELRARTLSRHARTIMDNLYPEPKVVCVMCHKYVPLDTATPFMLRGEEYHECADCLKPEDAHVPDPSLTTYIERHGDEIEMGLL